MQDFLLRNLVVVVIVMMVIMMVVMIMVVIMVMPVAYGDSEDG
jgi:hypothetical protein